MSKLSYTVKRLAQFVVTVWAIMTAIFVAFRVMPGDPTAYILSPYLDAEARQQIIENYGVNDPIHVQYVKFIESVLNGNLGYSFHSNEPVVEVITTFLPNSLILMLTATLLAYTIGILLGVYAGWNRDTTNEKSIVFAALTGRSFPAFWTAILGIWVFGAYLGWLPMTGMSEIGGGGKTLTEQIFTIDFWRHMVLPVLVLAFYYMGYPLLIMRSSMLDVVGEEYINLCRAKGVSERAIMFKHAARNAMLPTITATAIAIGFAAGGNVLVETVFGWPGIGRELVDAVLRRDYPVAQGIFFVFATIVVFMNLIADLIYGWFDPRVTY
jgi:peptide/nickel transport system permease protein